MKTYEEEFRGRIQYYNEVRKKICNSETLRELLMQNNYKELLEKQHNIIAVNTQILKQEKKCWSNQWKNHYRKGDIQHLIDPTKRPESEEEEEEFQKEELKRKIFHKWKKEIRIKAHTKHLYYQERFNNLLDRDTRLTGMKILQVKYIKEAFENYVENELFKIERLKALEKIKYTLIGKEKQEYMKLKKEFEINHINI